MITRASVQGWDNSSRGLDASTALEYVQSIRALTNMARTSTAVSLYQAGESLYELVDKVLLIHEGKCLYFGQADHAKQYFIDLGFECKPRWTTADFLTSVTDPHERAVRKGWEDRIPRTADEFASLYRASAAYERNLQDMDDFEDELEAQGRLRHANSSKKMNYSIPFYEQVLACTHRQFLVMLGDRASLIGKWGGIVFQVNLPTPPLPLHLTNIFIEPDCRKPVLSIAKFQRRCVSARGRSVHRPALQCFARVGGDDGCLRV